MELDLPLEGVLGAPELVWPTPSAPRMSEAEISKALDGGRLWFSTSPGSPEWSGLLSHLPEQAVRPVVVVPDATRRGPWQGLLKGLATHLLERWPSAHLTVLVASGVHKEVDELSLRKHLGFDSLSGGSERILFEALEGGRLLTVQHRADGSLEHAGETSRTTPVRLSPLYRQSDARLLLGGTSYHYFAGFGGGPKLIFPGVGGRSGIVQNHLLSLGGKGGDWEPHCAPSVLEGNPVAEDLAEAASMEPPHAMVLVLGLPGERVVASVWDRDTWLQGFRKGCDVYRSLHELPLARPLDGVVADAGGEPRDKHLLQVHKSLQHAVRFLRPGGWVLLVGACREGVGSPSLVELVERLGQQEVSRLYREAGESLHLQTAVALRAATRGRRVGFLSSLSRTSPERIRILGWEPLEDEEASVAWLEKVGTGRWGRLGEADTVLPAGSSKGPR
jgi:nickel-dependent lactate racemase